MVAFLRPRNTMRLKSITNMKSYSNVRLLVIPLPKQPKDGFAAWFMGAWSHIHKSFVQNGRAEETMTFDSHLIEAQKSACVSCGGSTRSISKIWINVWRPWAQCLSLRTRPKQSKCVVELRIIANNCQRFWMGCVCDCFKIHIWPHQRHLNAQ